MKRLSLYSTVLPKVRSNSLSTLAVVQPPTPSSTSRPAPKQSQHSQLALTHVQPSPALHPALISFSPQITSNPIQTPSSFSSSTPLSDQPRSRKRQRLNYQLDVGGYGIPKSHRSHRSFHSSTTNTYPHTSLSVQIGEDAYFIRDNAMGIADGVGGWAKAASQSQSPHIPTPSALFSRRLMHFCSAELDSLAKDQSVEPQPTTTTSSIRPPSISHFSFTHHLKPPPSPQPLYPPIHDTFQCDELSNSLEELSEGINVLNILERAYNSTLKAHTNPCLPIPTPLTTGSSTALVAVLDHPPQSSSSQDSKVFLHQLPSDQRNYAAGSLPQQPHPTFSCQPSASPKSEPIHTPLGTHTDPASHIPPSSPSQPLSNTSNISAGSQNNTFSIDSSATSHAKSQDVQSYDAVLRIAHLGDCMGMLVRADDIVWRSDEMWWGYNHPLQLGPQDPSSSSTTPTGKVPLPTQPHTFTLPVKQDDILILASDGLSDNLWDDDILDEVVKFRRNFDWDGTTSASSYSSTPVRSRSTSPSSRSSSSSFSSRSSSSSATTPESLSESLSNLNISSSTTLRRKSFASMLSEALCSRAKRVSERRGSRSSRRKQCESIAEEDEKRMAEEAIEIPFARRARMSGKVFKGGKPDDISVVVAIISAIDPSTRTEADDTKV